MDELCSRIDNTKLCARASLCRGVSCIVNLSAKNLWTMMGGQNCHVEITFDNNVKWLAQFRLSGASSPPLQARDYILRSKAATMTFLHMIGRVNLITVTL
ncbi:hypothetical protein K445DRAFT_22605 [Daldinia sp. EC12]|nr:hypothetical protein K445DRAFT_22605 [Daldinia sp. EC12]